MNAPAHLPGLLPNVGSSHLASLGEEAGGAPIVVDPTSPRTRGALLVRDDLPEQTPGQS